MSFNLANEMSLDSLNVFHAYISISYVNLTLGKALFAKFLPNFCQLSAKNLHKFCQNSAKIGEHIIIERRSVMSISTR
jgi:hypothetical protein